MTTKTPNLKRLAEDLIQKIPKRGISKPLQESPRLLILAQAYLAGVSKLHRGLLLSSTNLDTRRIDSLFYRFSQVIPEYRVGDILGNKELRNEAYDFKDYLREKL